MLPKKYRPLRLAEEPRLETIKRNDQNKKDKSAAPAKQLRNRTVNACGAFDSGVPRDEQAPRRSLTNPRSLLVDQSIAI